MARGNTSERYRSISGVLSWIGVGLPVLAGCALLWGTAGLLVGAYLAFTADLPKIPDLKVYHPKTVSTFYAEDSTVIGLFFREKRFPVSLDSLPPHVINAFIAAEDARFFSHAGVDWFGVLRAMRRNIETGNFAQGGSTITQQVTRSLLLSREKKISRKIREALLAHRIEKALTKREILEIYINEIYLGKGAYGIEAAAETYFGKTSRELTVAEAALLAGFVSNPSRYSAALDTDAPVKRKEFVLNNMLRHGLISGEEYFAASQEVPWFVEQAPSTYEKVPYFTEAVRQYIIAKYGENRLYNEGLQVWTTCDRALQVKASEALLYGVRGWERRQHRPAGLIRRLKPSEVQPFLQEQRTAFYSAGESVQALVTGIAIPRRTKGKKNENREDYHEVTLALPGGLCFTKRLQSSIPYKVNDVVQFKVSDVTADGPTLEHDSLPPVQGAVVTMENATGYVRALVGGLDFEKSNFNRALQALRQPGSAFKPLVFAAAMEWRRYSPGTIIVDEPISVLLDRRGRVWTPTNADRAFLGPITLRQALSYSRNTTAVKIFMDVGMDSTIRMARAMGITAPLRRRVALSLGASEVNLLDLTSAYTVFPNMGVKIPPVLVKKVVDRFGNVLEDHTTDRSKSGNSIAPAGAPESSETSGERLDLVPEETDSPEEEASPENRVQEHLSSYQAAAERFQQVLSPQTAYLMVSILRDACVSGTAAAVSRLGRSDLAGKTGTTDDSSDAWFVGFNPEYTTGVWLGYDIKTSLGRGEYGGKAALPIWTHLMKELLRNRPVTGYTPPPGIVFRYAPVWSHSAKLELLMDAGPDFAPEFPTKRMSSVDSSFVPASAPADFSNWDEADVTVPGFAPNGPHTGMVRLLSPEGRTLGYTQRGQDQKRKSARAKGLPIPGSSSPDSSTSRDPFKDFVIPAAASSQGSSERGAITGEEGRNK
jgi:penicillin-binding protein 1A